MRACMAVYMCAIECVLKSMVLLSLNIFDWICGCVDEKWVKMEKLLRYELSIHGKSAV